MSKSALVDSRDALSGLLRSLEQVLQDIRQASFDRDDTRSGHWRSKSSVHGSQVRQPGRQDRAAEDSDGSQANNCECMSSESEDEQVAVQDATRVLSIIVECGRFSLHTHELSGITHLSQNQATKLCCQSTAGTVQDIVLAATTAAAALFAARLRRVS